MKITPKPFPNQPGYRCTFRHPDTKQVSSYGLATTDPTQAEAVCNDIAALFEHKPKRIPKGHPSLLAYQPRAVEIVYGKEVADAVLQRKQKPVLDQAEIGTLTGRILAMLDLPADVHSIEYRKLDKVLVEFESQRYKELQEQFEAAETELKVLRPRCEEQARHIHELRRETNKHVTITVEEAYRQWKQTDDFKALSGKTAKEVLYTVDGFIASLPESKKFKLAALRASHITEWLNKLKKKDGVTALSMVTKAKMKRYLSVFVGAAYSDHDLAENPMHKTKAVKGAALAREEITAITQLGEFNELLGAVGRVDDYWHTLLATAMLAGPRYAELCHLKLEHVNLEGNYIRIATREDVNGNARSTKTGRERSVPIETTVLRTLLQQHVARRLKEQKKKNATEAEKSQFVFPSTVPSSELSPRRVSVEGVWSDNSTFLDAWRAIIEKAKAKSQATVSREYWKYGPREWRHCAGTAMGYAGNDTGRVAAWLGNSEDICRRHYKRPSESGTLWPFKW
jgi:integrase